MNQNSFIKGLLLLAVFFVVLLIFTTTFRQPDVGRVCIKEHCFDVILAKTPLDQQKGLMFEDKLDPDKGMLFVFNEEKRHAFWMKNTKIPLDIVWIDSNNTVVFISQNTQPCTPSDCPVIYPLETAKYILEIQGGAAERTGLQINDKVIINQ